MGKTLPRQFVVLQIPLHGIHLHHRVRDGRTGSEYHAAISRQPVKIARFHKHIAAFLRFGLGYARYVAHLCKRGEVFEAVGFVYKKPVNAQFFKGDYAVLFRRIVELFELGFQGFTDALHLLYGETLGVLFLRFMDAI